MTSLTKVVEIHKDVDGETVATGADIFVCETCTDQNAYTVVPEPETKDGVCEFTAHE